MDVYTKTSSPQRPLRQIVSKENPQRKVKANISQFPFAVSMPIRCCLIDHMIVLFFTNILSINTDLALMVIQCEQQTFGIQYKQNDIKSLLMIPNNTNRPARVVAIMMMTMTNIMLMMVMTMIYDDDGSDDM